LEPLEIKSKIFNKQSIFYDLFVLHAGSAECGFKKYIAREWELKQCLKTIKLVVTILVSAKANETRLNNLILLIAISYTISSFQVQKIKNKGVQEYISRTNEKGRKQRRYSSFFVELSMINWAINDDFHAKN
jgi:hypothetical protein